LIIVLAAGIALGIYLQKQPEVQKLETKTQADVGQADADAKGGTQKMDAVAADVKSDIKTGVEKSKEIATNVAAQVKAGAQKVGDFTTNAIGEIKQKLD
jgi:hypothetical protein